MKSTNRLYKLLVIGIWAALAAGCGPEESTKTKRVARNPAENPNQAELIRPSEIAKKEGDVVTLKSGLKYEDLKEGTGEAAKTGDTVLVLYTGRLADGKEFDSNVGREPYPVYLGVERVIRGWHEGIPGMKVGGKRKLIIPPALAYAKRGYPPVIPPDAELTFEIELVKIR